VRESAVPGSEPQSLLLLLRDIPQPLLPNYAALKKKQGCSEMA